LVEELGREYLMLEEFGKSWWPSFSALPPAFGPSLGFPGSTFLPLFPSAPSPLEFWSLSTLPVLGVSSDFDSWFSTGISSFDSSYKHKDKSV
jgi:hypothetical protein